jgi:uncharacterized protein (DUF2336 family)
VENDVTVADDVEQIGRWRPGSDPAEGERLLAALEDLAATEKLDASPRAQAVVGQLLSRVAAGAGPDLRGRVARWAAEGRCTPRELAVDLAFDGIEVSGPVIRRSPALLPEDLLRLIGEGAAAHQIAVGARQQLDTAVVEAILEQGEPSALAALAGNPRAPLAPEHLELLVGMSKRLPALRVPLARHASLTPGLAEPLGACSGPGVRRVLAKRFGTGASGTASATPEGCERRLAAKLQLAGRLSPGYALRVLREGKLTMFEHALAALSGLPHQEVRAALDAESAGPLVRACAAAGIDRSVVPLILAEVRRLNAHRPGDAPEPRRRAPRARRNTPPAAPKPRASSKARKRKPSRAAGE